MMHPAPPHTVGRGTARNAWWRGSALRPQNPSVRPAACHLPAERGGSARMMPPDPPHTVGRGTARNAGWRGAALRFQNPSVRPCGLPPPRQAGRIGADDASRSSPHRGEGDRAERGVEGNCAAPSMPLRQALRPATSPPSGEDQGFRPLPSWRGLFSWVRQLSWPEPSWLPVPSWQQRPSWVPPSWPGPSSCPWPGPWRRARRSG